jgi:hypothetical protein
MPSLRSPVLVLLAVLTIAAPSVFARTKTVHRWRPAGGATPQFHRILVAEIVDDYVLRQQFEDEMNKRLARFGVEGVPSYVVLPPKNEMMESELKQRIADSSFDSVLVIRPKTTQTATRGAYAPSPGSYSFWPYWNATYTDAHPATWPKDNSRLRLEVNLYSTKTERLVWSGETRTIDPKDLEKFAKRLTGQLRRDRLLRRSAE